MPTLFQQWLSMTKKWKSMAYRHSVFFSNKLYMTYQCIPELVVTAAAARRTTAKKIKPLVYLHISTNILFLTSCSFCFSCSSTAVTSVLFSFAEFLSAVVKIRWHYHHFLRLSITFAVFHDFQGMKNGPPKFHDFSWLSRTSGHPVFISIFCVNNLSAYTQLFMIIVVLFFTRYFLYYKSY